jgi:hypothetical protein
MDDKGKSLDDLSIFGKSLAALNQCEYISFAVREMVSGKP